MTILTTQNYFLGLAVLATFLLWGISLLNGTVKELVVTSWYGVFEDGTPFHTRYTGIFLIDFPISLLVAFFFYGTNGSDQAYQHFLIDAYSTLQSAFIWLYIESGRDTSKPRSVADPVIWGIIWQCFGAAISLPLYFYYHLDWTQGQPEVAANLPLNVAMSIPVSTAFGAILPAVIGMLPTWYPRNPQTHQTILALWQPDPLWVSLVQAGSIFFIKRLNSKTEKVSEDASSSWIRFSYLFAALSSATGHVYVAFRIATSNDSGMSLLRMYVPKTFTGIRDELKLVDGPWLFLQYDLIIISLSSLSWAYILVSRLSADKKPLVPLSLIFLLGFIGIGAGATVSLALYWREFELQQRRGIVKQRKSALAQTSKNT